MDDPKLICARLLREAAVERSELRALDYPDIRADVERRLSDVGLTLATSAYSRHVGLRLSADVTADKAFDSASNLRLQADHCALLVVLWARLVLQKRTAADTRQVPGQIALLAEDRSKAAREFEPFIRFETLAREFGAVFGSRTHLHGLVTTLRRLRFLSGKGEVIEAGPLLELGVDGEKMIAFIRRRVLSDLLGQQEKAGVDEPTKPTVEEQVCNVIEGLGGEASMKQLEAETGERPDRLRVVLRELQERGVVARTGVAAKTRYHVVRT
jgi:hypothetical protein